MSTNVQTRERLDFVDAQRGLAVVLMIWMHTADAWLLPSLKHGGAWDVVRSLGGLAAPTFLLLVGLSLGLGWARAGEASQGATWAASRRELARGLQLVVLGYGLRVQMWMIDAGGFRAPGGVVGAALLTLSYAALYRGLGAWAGGSAWWREAAVAGAASALAWSGVLAAQQPPLSLLRVDVLQAIGASLALLVLARPALATRPALGILFGVLVALATPWLKRWVPGPLPVPLASYVAQWPPAPGERVASLFPLFPWAAYALIGAAFGSFLARAAARGESARAVGKL
ncbi:MAG TPA: heparan-alpha-glucosaminide N-acetyltransferase domain-containing protein, partial [Polyangiales bacterium]|nr:heparan-alpha-glucosaminide N-acetyltransferase domain-containing protein [Polyangiales bacterium]